MEKLEQMMEEYYKNPPKNDREWVEHFYKLAKLSNENSKDFLMKIKILIPLLVFFAFTFGLSAGALFL